MDILRNLFGNVASGIVRLLVTVGILAAAYLFIVKPVLDTTENVSDTVNNSIQSANESFRQSFGPNSEAEKAIHRANRRVKIQITRSFHQAKTHSGGDPTKMLHCIQAAAGDVNKMQRCAVKFSP
jgi:F0F1-type ATP synthase membrane subunit b/b'